jgi:hypothetical protein
LYIYQGGVVTLEDAANVLLEEHDERNVKYKSKMTFCLFHVVGRDFKPGGSSEGVGTLPSGV